MAPTQVRTACCSCTLTLTLTLTLTPGANSVLLLHVDVVVVLESVRMLLAAPEHTPGAADDLRGSVGGLTAQHFIGDEVS